MNIPMPVRRRAAMEEMLPLINVVFLLIMFFLMTGQIGSNVRKASQAQALTVSGGDDKSRLGSVVDIDSDGHLRWDGAKLSDAQLVLRAIDWAARNPHTGLAVQADAQTPADRVVEVFTTLQGAGVSEVRLLARTQR